MLKLTQKLIAVSLIALTSVVSVITINQPSHAQTSRRQGTRFYCSKKGGEYFTMSRTDDGNRRRVMKFESTEFPPPYDNIQTSCQEISSRFQRSYDNGTLRTIVAGKYGKQVGICAVKYRNGTCNNGNLLFTLKPGTTFKEAKDVANRLFNKNALANGKIVARDDGDLVFDAEDYLNALPGE